MRISEADILVIPGYRGSEANHWQSRWEARLSTPMSDLHDFYDAFTPRFEEAIDYCDKYPLDDIPDDALNLLYLVYSMIMVSMAIEVFGTQKPADSADAVIDRVSAPVP